MDTETVQQDFLVIARKWRPQFFDDVIGQEHITTTLKNAILFNRVAHGYLFCGSRGVGKTSTARIFARALNCVNGPTLTPCGQCPACIEIIQGNCLDVIEIDGASNRGIEQIRELRESVKFVPNYTKYKIYIVDEVHMLTKEAFNALLKTLEEPPAHAIFIFATTEPHEVPQTILSRCQVFEFHRINSAHIAAQLGKIARSEGIETEPGVLEAVAKAGDGSMRDSQSMFDQVISFCGNKITFNQLSNVLGLYERDTFFDITDFAYNGNIAEGIKIIGSIISSGKNLNHFIDGLLNHFRYLLMVKILEEKSGILDCPQEFLDKYSRQSDLYTAGELEFAVELISETGIKLRYALSRQIVIELLFLKLSRLKTLMTVDQALYKLEELDAMFRKSGMKIPQTQVPLRAKSTPPVNIEDKTGPVNNPPQPIKTDNSEPPVNSGMPDEPFLLDSDPLPQTLTQQQPQQVSNPVAVIEFEEELQQEKTFFQQSPPSPANNMDETKPQSALSLNTIEKSWHSFCKSCENQLLSLILENNAKLEGFESGLLYIGIDEFNFSLFREREQEISSFLRKYFGENINAKFKLANNNAKPKPVFEEKHEDTADMPQTKPAGTTRREDQILNDPAIQKLVDAFDAKIITVRRKQ